MPDLADQFDKLLKKYVPPRWRKPLGGLAAVVAFVALLLGVGVDFKTLFTGAGPPPADHATQALRLGEKALDESSRSHRWGEEKADAYIAHLEAEKRDLAEQNTEYRRQLAEAFTQLQALRDRPDPPVGIDEVIARAETGDTAGAEAIFADVASRKEAEGAAARKSAAEAYRQLGALAFLNETEKSLAAYRKATDLDPDNPNGWNMLGILLERIGDLPGAEDAYKRVRGIGEQTGDTKAVAAATGNLGIIYSKRGDPARAEEMYRKALDLDENLGDKEGVANAYGNLGVIYWKRGDLARAEEMHRKALDLNKVLDRKEGLANQYANLGLVYEARGDLDRAEEMLRKALDLNKVLGRKESLADAFSNLGIVYRKRDDLDRAEEAYLKALDLYKQLGHKEGMANVYTNLGVIYRRRGRLDRAEEVYLTALDLHKTIGLKEGMANDYGNLGTLCATRGDIPQAREHYEKALALFEQVGARPQIEQTRANLAALDD